MDNRIFVLAITSNDVHPIRFQRHLSGQAKALSDFGLQANSKPGWPAEKRAPISMVHVTDAGTGQTVAGACVQFRRDGFRLPTELNLDDPEVTLRIEARATDDPCEVCGVWIAKDYRKIGLLPYLFSGAVAAAHMGGARTNFSSAHEKSARAHEELGVSVERERVYHWPDERYRTYLLHFEVDQYLRSHSREGRLVQEICRVLAHSPRFAFELTSPAGEGMKTEVSAPRRAGLVAISR